MVAAKRGNARETKVPCWIGALMRGEGYRLGHNPTTEQRSEPR